MTPELEQQLLNHPSKFYSQLIYFECYDGWLQILTKLADNVQNLHLEHRVYASQVKEKYGRLRIYITSPNYHAGPSLDQVEVCVKEAEQESWSTCEHCGRLASLRRIGGHLSTLCDDDYQQWLNRIRAYEPARREDPETTS